MAKVFVGLSGGVDSAVSAYLLKKEGHDVTGVFIKGWEPDFLPCTGTADRLSAMPVAAHLGIPFKTYDLSEEYKESVVDYFVAEYKAGRTPNPDVMCNRTIKFGAMWERARSEGADYVATGHYADTNGVALRASKDASKNQTYFLWTLTKDDLAHVRFPLGKLTKPEVRALAKKVKLPNAVRPDSQGLCFLGHVDMQEFLKRYIPVTPGAVITEDGESVGVHDGVWFYTLGQHVATSLQERVYVVEKRVDDNVLVVSRTPQTGETGARTSLDLVNENWIAGEVPAGVVHVEFRYHGPRVRARVEGRTVHLEKGILVAPGQSLVCYDQTGVVCLGGGVVA